MRVQAIVAGAGLSVALAAAVVGFGYAASAAPASRTMLIVRMDDPCSGGQMHGRTALADLYMQGPRGVTR